MRLISPKEIMPVEIRKGDRSIIHECVRMGYKETDLVRLNRVRNFLQVIYVSDLVEYDGKTIKQAVIEGRKDDLVVSDLTWRKEKP